MGKFIWEEMITFQMLVLINRWSLGLARLLYSIGRNITTTSYFISIPLAQKLLQNGVIFLGTLCANNSEIPIEFLKSHSG